MKDIIVLINDSEHLLQTDIDEPIVRTALNNDLKLIHSCLKGECRSCRAYLLSGEVDMKNNFSLFEEEVKQGQILLCQSYPVSNEVMVKPVRIPRGY